MIAFVSFNSRIIACRVRLISIKANLNLRQSFIVAYDDVYCILGISSSMYKRIAETVCVICILYIYIGIVNVEQSDIENTICMCADWDSADRCYINVIVWCVDANCVKLVA